MVIEWIVAAESLLKLIEQIERAGVAAGIVPSGQAPWLGCPLLSALEYDHTGIDESNDSLREKATASGLVPCTVDPVPVIGLADRVIRWLPASGGANVQEQASPESAVKQVPKILYGMVGMSLMQTAEAMLDYYFFESHWGACWVYLRDWKTQSKRVSEAELKRSPLFLYAWRILGYPECRLQLDARQYSGPLDVEADPAGAWKTIAPASPVIYPSGM